MSRMFFKLLAAVVVGKMFCVRADEMRMGFFCCMYNVLTLYSNTLRGYCGGGF